MIVVVLKNGTELKVTPATRIAYEDLENTGNKMWTCRSSDERTVGQFHWGDLAGWYETEGPRARAF